MYCVSFEIPGLPKMTNPSGAKSTHWRFKQAEAKKWKELTGWAVLQVGKPARPLKYARLILMRHSAVSPDADGLVSGFKHIVDGLTEAGVIQNDKYENIGMPHYLWRKAPQKQGKVTVIVIEADEAPEPYIPYIPSACGVTLDDPA